MLACTHGHHTIGAPFKGMQIRVIDQVNHHLAERARLAMEHDSVGNGLHHGVGKTPQTGGEGVHNFCHRGAQVKAAALFTGLVCRHLPEVANEFVCAQQVLLRQASGPVQHRQKAAQV